MCAFRKEVFFLFRKTVVSRKIVFNYLKNSKKVPGKQGEWIFSIENPKNLQDPKAALDSGLLEPIHLFDSALLKPATFGITS